MDRKDHAAPPDDGHQGSYTVPSDVIVPGHEEPALPGEPARAEPRLHTDPQPHDTPPRRIKLDAVLGGVALAVVLAAIALFTFLTSAPQ